MSKDQAARQLSTRHTRLTVAGQLTVLAAGMLVAYWMATSADHDLREDMLQQARMLAQTVSIDCVRTLSGTEKDLASPSYQRLKGQLSAARAAVPKSRFLYLMGRKADGAVYFFVDSEPVDSKDYSPPGQAYEEVNASDRRVFDTQSEAVVGPSADRWGSWISALVPINDPQSGATVAVFAMDVDAGVWKWLIARAAMRPVLLALALAVLLSAVSFLTRRVRSYKAVPFFARHYELSVIIAVGLILTLFAAWAAHKNETLSRTASFRQLAESQTARIAEKLRSVGDTELEGLARFCGANETITPQKFQQFAQYLTNNSSFQAWEWIPAVPADDKARFEAAADAAGLTGFQIWQKDALGNRSPVAGRAVYYPVFLVAPMAGNERALGYDLGSEPLRCAAMQDAARTRLPTGTDAIALVQETGRQKGMLVYRPVFSSDDPARLSGFALAVLRMETLLKAAVEDRSALMDLALLRPDATLVPLASMRSPGLRPASGLFATRIVFAFDKIFSITAWPTPAFLHLHPIRAGWLVALAGLLLTIAMADILSFALLRREELERVVFERTAELRESEVHLSATLRSIGDGVVAVDASGTVTSLNAAAETFTGWSTGQARGRPVAEVFRIVHAATRRELEDPTRRALLEDRTITPANDTALVSRDGSERQIADSCAPIHDSEGTVIGAVLVFRDVTDERRQRELLHTATARLSLAARAGGVGIWDFDVVNNRLVWDSQMYHLYGIEAGQFGGAYEAWQAGLHPDDRARGDAEIQMALCGKKEFDTEFRVVWPDGSTRNIRALAVVQRDASGLALHMIGTNWDITAQKKAEALLQWNASFLNLMAHSSPLGFLVVDNRTDKILYFNHRFCEIWGIVKLEERLSRGELTNNQIIPDCLPMLADIPAFAESCKPLQSEHNRIVLEDYIPFVNGRTIRRYSTQMRGDKDEYFGRFYIFEDVTERMLLEAEVKSSEANFRTFFESMTDMIIVGTPDGRVRFTNAAVTRALGYSAGELASMHVLDLHPMDRRQEAGDVLAAMFRGERESCPLPLARKNGSLVPVDTRVWFGKWDGLDCIFSISKDLTEQQAALEKFQKLFDSNPAPMAISTLPGRRFMEVNNAFLSRLGFARDEVIGKTSEELSLFQDREEGARIKDELQSRGRVAGKEVKVRTRGGELMEGLLSGEVIDNQGQKVFLTVMVDITAQRAAEQELRYRVQIENLIVSISTLFMNIDSSLTDQAIRDSMAQVGKHEQVDRVYVFLLSHDRALMSNTHEWCAAGVEPEMQNLQDIPTSAMPWWMERLRSQESIHIPRVRDLPPEAAGERAVLEAQGIQSLLAVPMVWKGELSGFLGFDSVSSERSWSGDRIAPMEMLGNIFIGAMRRKQADQTLHASEEALRDMNNTLESRIQERTRELQQAQSRLYLQEKLASIGQLAAGLAHEINNPVCFVATNFATLVDDVQAMRDTLVHYRRIAAQIENVAPWDEQVAAVREQEKRLSLDFVLNDIDKLFQESRAGFRRITGIINSMRNFSRSDEPRSLLPYDLNDGIGETLVISRNSYKYHADVETELGVLPEITCVPGEINQVLLNLVVNAAQASALSANERRGRISVRTWADAGSVSCEVADNGPGMTPDILRRLFEPFFTTKPPGQGSGLGLSICYDIVVRKHHGQLAVDSSPGQGSRFTVTLPIERPSV
jgi:PAS domain S-box-containing protein